MFSHCYFLHASDILHVDQISQDWKHFVGYPVCSGLFLHGKEYLLSSVNVLYFITVGYNSSTIGKL